MTLGELGQIVVTYSADGYIHRVERIGPDGASVWSKIVEPDNPIVRVTPGVLGLTWNTFSGHLVIVDPWTGEELERHFTK
jgi:hypothetical protein